MTSTTKTIVGIILLIVGAWVTWAGFQEGETVTIIMGIASLVGGVAFLATRGRAGMTVPRT